MATLAGSLVSASSRRLPLRRRGDLIISSQRYQGRTFWVVKDPVGLTYFRLREEEYFVLQSLDGNISLDSLKEEFEKKFAPRKITLFQLQAFIAQLHKGGLILSNFTGQGNQLLDRNREKTRQQIIGYLSNVLAIRFRGIDPERLLTFLHPFVKWMYSTWCVLLCCALAVSALLLVLIHFDEFRTKLPAFHEFFQVRNVIWLTVALAVTKIIHEFGHGMTCKHFGGECHEMGAMLLVLTPCLYCNVSDSWLLPNKWHRAAIGAAGMYVEMLIATACTYLWWFSEPGLLNYLCLSTMFVCSVSTVIFNGNPLLRYDGYYILSDVLEIPNLWQKSQSVLNRFLGKFCLGLTWPEDPFLPEKHRFFFGLYAVASTCYRWFVLFSILWFLYTVLEPYNLEIVGRVAMLVSILGMLISPSWRAYQFFTVPGRLREVKAWRVVMTLSLLTIIVGGILYIPFPRYVYTTILVEARDAQRIWVNVPGRLIEVNVQPGQQVETGAPLARLMNLQLEVDALRLKAEYDEQRQRCDNLQRQSFTDPEAEVQLMHARKTLETIQDRLQKSLIDLNLLKLQAPLGGTILPPDLVPKAPRKELSRWWGSTLEERNLGCFLEKGTLLCSVGNPRKLQAMLIVDQADIEFVQRGQVVDIQLDELQLQRFRGAIRDVAQIQVENLPKSLSAKLGSELPTRTDASGKERPMSTSYQALVPLDDPEGVMLLGMRGRAKINTGMESLGRWVWRYLNQTFHFHRT